MRILAYRPIQRKADMLNLEASLKGAIDGLQDAGVIADDSGFVTWPGKWLKGPERKIVVELWIDE